jgi:ABC-type multidrug transport system ATPase subunit
MDEAERLADRIVVLARGEVVAEGTPGSAGATARRR